MTEPSEELATAFGRFVGLIRDRATAGLASPDRRGSDNALRDIYAAAEHLLAELEAEVQGAARDPQLICGREGCGYLALDAEDYAEHVRLNHAGGS